MSLRARVALFVAIAVGVTVATVAGFAYRSTRSEAYAEIDRSLLGRVPITGLPDLLGTRPGQGPGAAARRAEVAALISDDVLAQVVFPDGRIVVLGSTESVLPVDEADLAIAAGARTDLLRTVIVAGAPHRLITRPVPGTRVAVQIARDLTETETILAGLRNRLLLVGLAGALLAALLGWWLAGRAVRPVQRLTVAAEQVASTGALDAAIPVERTDEIGRLATAFNLMLERLAAMRAVQQRLIADASHELRTPLTSLRTNIELLSRGGIPAEDEQEMLRDLRTEVSELGDLLAELVDLAIVGGAEEEPTPFDLADVVSSAVERLRRRTPHPVSVTGTATPVTARRGAVTRAVTNLLDNAAKWGPVDQPIDVTLDRTGLVVEDRGPGFAPEDLPFVFQRFYRSATARNLPGSGLGLAIVAAVAEDHGWETSAGNREGGGARVAIVFPPAVRPPSD